MKEKYLKHYSETEIDEIIEILNCPEEVCPSMSKLIESKGSFSFFKGLSISQIKKIATNVHFHKHKKGEIIIRENEVSEEVYFLMSGRCNVVANRQIVGEIKPGQVFGEIAALTKEKRSAMVRAIEDNSIVLRFEINHKNASIETEAFSILYKNLLDEVIEKLIASNERKKR